MLEEQIVNWIKCEKCNTKLIPIEAIIAQAWINSFHPLGVTVHNFECPKYHTRWSCIIFSDDEAWGFLQIERKYVEKVYNHNCLHRGRKRRSFGRICPRRLRPRSRPGNERIKEI